jgi:hypothetical protein
VSTLALDGVTPRSRTTDPTTSVDAGRGARLAASQEAVLEAFLKLNRPIADHELVAWLHATSRRWFSESRIRTARSELTEAGSIVLVEGQETKTPSGCRAQLWRLA